MSEGAQSLAGFMADHGVFGFIGEDALERRGGIGLVGLAKAVGEFVFEEGGGGGEGGGDGVDGWLGPLRGEVLEGEEGAEAEGEVGRSVVGEDAAELGDGVGDGHF